MASVQTACANNLLRLIKAQTFFGHIIHETLQAHQRRMSLVAMVHILLNAEFLECEHATDTEHNLLFETVLVVTTVELVRNRAVPFAIELVVGIQQIQTDTTNRYAPQVRMYLTIRIRHIDNHRCTICFLHLFNRQILEVLRLVVGNLLAFRTQRLGEIAITVQETDSRHIYIAIRCLFQVVTGQNTQTTAVYLQDVRQTVFHREISDRRFFLDTRLVHISTELRVHAVQAIHKCLVLT